MIEIKSERFVLRPWRKSDLPSLVKYANNKKIADFLRDGFPFPYTEKDGRIFIKMAIKAKPINILAIEVNKEAVGSIGFFMQHDVHRLNAEIGYWLAEPFWGKGIMPEAVKIFSQYIFENYHVIRLYAEVFAAN
ncbi:MAG: GNAT family N-acetyltransferase, partial [Saprospiraceae bacterium]|nr:GNAT family N-acetyltransferase [Saprospiraceae bacterium]